MCGIYGFVNITKRKFDEEKLKKIALSNWYRGQEAFGYAFYDKHEHLGSFKSPGNPIGFFHHFENIVNYPICVFHCRKSTVGDPKNNDNNHPFPVYDGYFVHNGSVLNAYSLIKKHRFEPYSECDSAVIAELMDSNPNRSLYDRTKYAIEQISGKNSIVVVGENKLIITKKNGQDLHLAYDFNAGLFLFSSNKLCLNGSTSMRNNSIIELTIDNNELILTHDELLIDKNTNGYMYNNNDDVIEMTKDKYNPDTYISTDDYFKERIYVDKPHIPKGAKVLNDYGSYVECVI